MEQIAKIVVRVRIVIPRDEIAFDAHFFKGSDTFFERPRAALVTKKNQSIRLARVRGGANIVESWRYKSHDRSLR